MKTAMPINRRNFIQTLTGAGLAGIASRDVSYAQMDSAALPPPSQSGIDHVVVVTMENRSFDHFLGWLPGADGRQAGLTYNDASGVPHATAPLAPDYTGCPHPDPDHSYHESRVAYDNGAMDGFLRAGSNDVYSIGYYTQPDLPFFSALAQNYLVCDRYFASILGPTFPNRLFMWGAQTDRLGDTVSFTSIPTIFDRLAAAGVSHRYFFNNVPFLALWGLKYATSTGLFAEFLFRAAIGALPAVSFIDPIYTVLDDGTGNDDHPHADIRNGDVFLATVFHALATSPSWRKTLLVINFDEWGGFFEHVAPPRAVAPNSVDPDVVSGQVLLGFRVPTLIASPFTRNTNNTPLVNHTLFDHTSVLKLIEWRWNLPPLTARDASPQIGNLAAALNFAAPNAAVPSLPRPVPVVAAPCLSGGILNSASAFSSEIAPREARPQAGPWASLAGSRGMNEWRNAGRLPFSR